MSATPHNGSSIALEINSSRHTDTVRASDRHAVRTAVAANIETFVDNDERPARIKVSRYRDDIEVTIYDDFAFSLSTAEDCLDNYEVIDVLSHNNGHVTFELRRTDA